MVEDFTQHIAVLNVAIHIPQAQSLKDKRMVLRSLKERIKSRFNVSVAELSGQDKWQIATLGVVMIANDNRLLDSAMQTIFSYIENHPEYYVCEHKIEFI